MLERGKIQRRVTDALNNQASVLNRSWHRYHVTNDVREQHTGPAITRYPGQDRFIQLQELKTRTSTATQLANELQRTLTLVISDQTVKKTDFMSMVFRLADLYVHLFL